jgi:hypothetical protein
MAFIGARMRRSKTDKPAASVEVVEVVDEEASVEGADDEFDDEEVGEDEEGDEEEDEGEDEEETPCVVLGRLSDLRGYGDPGLLRKHGERPVWFIIQDDADFMTLFDRHRERPVPPALSRSIMDVLRSFAASESDALQTVLGSTDTIEFGFHEGASVDEVTEVFEEDGFDVAFVLRDGKVVDEVDDAD